VKLAKKNQNERMILMARELKRLNTYMPLELVVRVDEYANRMHLNRSAAINMLVSIALQQENDMSIIYELLNRLFSELDEKARAK
jgi:mannitol/fructose-specific phosphotransferase system IIA component